MKYKLEVVIDLPREKVIELFDNPGNLKKWQPTLLSMDHLSGTPGQVGAKTNLCYMMGKRECKMVETIVEREFPDTFCVTYEAVGVWNRVDNRFIELATNRTLWKFTSEFKCSGYLKIMAFLMPGLFKKESLKMMNSFKQFAEKAV